MSDTNLIWPALLVLSFFSGRMYNALRRQCRLAKWKREEEALIKSVGRAKGMINPHLIGDQPNGEETWPPPAA